MPNKVLHILGTAQLEATAHVRIIGPLTRGLDPARYAVEAWFLGEEGPLVGALEAAGARVRVVKWRGGRWDPAGAWRFWSGLRSEEFAIIHQHWGGRSVRWLARAATGAAIVLHLHGRVAEPYGPKPILLRARGVDTVIANSHAVAAWVVGMQPQVVYPGVCIPSDDGRESSLQRIGREIVIGTAGRLVPIKGTLYLVRALAALRPEFSNLRLEIAGAGPERMAIENEVRLLDLQDSVTFLGWQTDLASVLVTWDVFVQPSLEEGFGIATLEAMAAGLPVIATAVGGLPELVKDGRTGWLVPPGDSTALAERLRLLLLNPEKRHAMGAAGQARARDSFSIERMVEAISKIYDDLLDLRGVE